MYMYVYMHGVKRLATRLYFVNSSINNMYYFVCFDILFECRNHLQSNLNYMHTIVGLVAMQFSVGINVILLELSSKE